MTYPYIVSNSPSQVKQITLAGKTYRYGESATGWFVKETASGERIDFSSPRAFTWFMDRLIEAAGDTDPEPTPAAAPVYAPEVLNVCEAIGAYFQQYTDALATAGNRKAYQSWGIHSQLRDAERRVGLAAQMYIASQSALAYAA